MDIAFSFEELGWTRSRHCENSCGFARLNKRSFSGISRQPPNNSMHVTPTAAHSSQVAIALETGWYLYHYERARDFKHWISEPGNIGDEY